MKFIVLSIDDVDIKNKFYVGEIFEGDYHSVDLHNGYLQHMVFDCYKNRAIEVEKVKEV